MNDLKKRFTDFRALSREEQDKILAARRPPKMVECGSCGGSGKIWDECETPKMDNWRRCMDCTGTGQVPTQSSR